MLKQIQGKSLDELEELIVRFSQEQVEQKADSKHYKDVSARGIEASSSQGDSANKTIDTASISSRSMFRLFARQR
jgi:hypothetical protein